MDFDKVESKTIFYIISASITISILNLIRYADDYSISQLVIIGMIFANMIYLIIVVSFNSSTFFSKSEIMIPPRLSKVLQVTLTILIIFAVIASMVNSGPNNETETPVVYEIARIFVFIISIIFILTLNYTVTKIVTATDKLNQSDSKLIITE